MNECKNITVTTILWRTKPIRTWLWRDRAFYDIPTATNDTWLSVCSVNQNGGYYTQPPETVAYQAYRQWHTDSGIQIGASVRIALFVERSSMNIHIVSCQVTWSVLFCVCVCTEANQVNGICDTSVNFRDLFVI